MLKTLKMAAAALVLATSGAAMANAEPLKVGFSPEAYAPFYVADAAGNWAGWEVEIVNAICAEAKFECEMVPIPVGRPDPGADHQEDRRDHEFHVDHRRAQEDDRLLRQVLQQPTVVIGAEGRTGRPGHARGLKGKIIGVQVSTVHAPPT